mgnify:CR=1 FL=1
MELAVSRIDSWLGAAFPLADWLNIDWAIDTALLIAEKSVSIVAVRNGTAQAAQTVRLETLSGPRQILGSGGVTHQIDGLLLGYKGHPTISDSDFKAGDTFANEGKLFEIVAVMPGILDSIQCYLKVKT